ncbi:MAG: hydrolase 2, exosortase A system-associated [Gammaproteobacteria bacterium]
MAGGTFLPAPNGDIYVARWVPDREITATVLIVPPFAEEMNKCRPMLALTARLLAREGFQVLAPDLVGTGDSAGEFRDARLDHWRADLATVADWAARDGAPVTRLVGMRFGALLALELAASLPGPLRIALWQPVASGQLQLTQFLRLRVAGALLAGAILEGGRAAEKGAESVASLTAELKAGKVFEVGGYELSPGLAADLQGPEIRQLAPPPDTSLRWFEVGAGESPELSRVAADRLRDWVAAGVPAEGIALAGDSFWNTVELTTCPALAEQTARFLASAA